MRFDFKWCSTGESNSAFSIVVTNHHSSNVHQPLMLHSIGTNPITTIYIMYFDLVYRALGLNDRLKRGDAVIALFY